MNKLKILIVDDEHLIRQLIKAYLKEKQQDFTIAGEASSAPEAIEFLDENKADIIITDINMPLMNGLEMSRRIMETNSNIKIMAVTGYDDFEYARQGIKLGIEDYLLKPIQANELYNGLYKIREKILADRSRELEYQDIRRHMEESLPALRDSFFVDLINARAAVEGCLENLAFAGVNFSSELFSVAVVTQLARKTASDEDLFDLFALKSILSDNLPEGEAFIFFDDYRRLVMLHCLEDIEQTVDYEYLKNILTGSVDCTLSVGVGSLAQGAQGIAAAYKQAVQAMSCYTFLGGDRVIFYDELGILDSVNAAAPRLGETDIEQLSFYIKGGLPLNAREWIEARFERDWEDIEPYRLLGVQIVIGIHTAGESTKLDTGPLLSKLLELQTAPEIKELLSDIVTDLASSINSSRMNAVSDTLTQIEEYILENLASSSLSLTGTAKHFYMNASYLSRVFKQRRGISFRDYINKARIEKSLEYLGGSEVKAYEVGALVGIDDPNYFSTLFKKYTGMTITQYRGKI